MMSNMTARVRGGAGVVAGAEAEADAAPAAQGETRGGNVGFLGLLSEQIGRYRTVVAWFAKDAYGRFRGRVLLIFAYSLLAMGCLMGALGVIFFYIRALEDGTVLTYGAYEIVTRESTVLLIAAATAGLLLFAASFVFKYAANLQALAIGRAYEEHCTRRAIALIGAHGGRPEARAWAGETARLIQSDPRLCGRVARITVNMILPVLVFAATFAVLLVLDLWLTLAVIVLIGAALPFLYVVNVRGARHSIAMEETKKAAIASKRQLVATNAERGAPLNPDSPEMRQPFSEGAMARHLDAYVGRLRASDNSELVTNIVMGIGVVVILASKSSQILATGQGWSELAVYMVALRVNLTSVTQASTTLTSVNRFYPQVARYFRFLRDMEGLPANPPFEAPSERPAELAAHDEDEE